MYGISKLRPEIIQSEIKSEINLGRANKFSLAWLGVTNIQLSQYYMFPLIEYVITM